LEKYQTSVLTFAIPIFSRVSANLSQKSGFLLLLNKNNTKSGDAVTFYLNFMKKDSIRPVPKVP
jgi:hypothetical protein